MDYQITISEIDTISDEWPTKRIKTITLLEMEHEKNRSPVYQVFIDGKEMSLVAPWLKGETLYQFLGNQIGMVKE